MAATTAEQVFGTRTVVLTYDEQLTTFNPFPLVPQTFTYIAGFGRSVFSRQSTGEYRNATAPHLRGAVVTINPADGTRELRFKDGTRHRFNANGRMIARIDRHGNTVTIGRGTRCCILRLPS